uniref:N-alpha-acetyltransferase 60 n=1 Tax=Rhabditophanes sp. KR3021 TaxID=114890 RepID=A0AC35U293_9BILA
MIVPLMEEDAEKNLVINSGTKNFNITDNPDWLVKPLSKEDYYAVKALCTESFPVKYPESFYEDVVEGRFIAFGYFYKDVLTSLMICEIKAICEYEARDRKLLSDGNGHALYILSLAVRGKYRRKGIASALLSYLLNVIVKECPHVGVIFLHAVTYNYGAIKFYKESGFKLHTTLK